METAGVQRRSKDCCTTVFNNLQKWDELKSRGAKILENASNARILLIDPESAKESCPDFDKSGTLAECQKSCERLAGVVEGLGAVVEKLEASLSHLERLGFSINYVTVQDTRTAKELLADLVPMYRKELACSKAILSDILSSERNVLTTLNAAWIHQPYLCNDMIVQCKEILESIVS